MAIEVISNIKQKNNGTFKIVDSHDVGYSNDGLEGVDSVKGALDNIYGLLNAEPKLKPAEVNGDGEPIYEYKYKIGDVPILEFIYESRSPEKAQIVVTCDSKVILQGRYAPGRISLELSKVTSAAQKVFNIAVTDLNSGLTASINIVHIYGGVQLTSINALANLSKITFTNGVENSLELNYVLEYYVSNTFTYYITATVYDLDTDEIVNQYTYGSDFSLQIRDKAYGTMVAPIKINLPSGVKARQYRFELQAIVIDDDELEESNIISDTITVIPSNSIVAEIVSVSDGSSESSDTLGTDDMVHISCRLFTSVGTLSSIDTSTNPLEIRYWISGDNLYYTSNEDGIPTVRGKTQTINLGRIPSGNYTVVVEGHASNNDDTGIDIISDTFEFNISESADTTQQYVTKTERNLIAYFTSEGKNNSANKDFWYAENNPNYYFKLNHFDYTETGSGWAIASEAEDPSTVLKFNSSSYAAMYKLNGSTEIPFKPMSLFNDIATAAGQTFEILFKSNCIGVTNTNIATCINDNDANCAGYSAKYDTLKAINAYSTGAARKIAEGRWTHVAFVFDSNIRSLDQNSENTAYDDVTNSNIEDANPFATARIYIDGCLSSVNELNRWSFETASGTSTNAMQLLLNAAFDSSGNPTDFGSCEIKMVRIYGAALTSSEILKNYISTIRNSTERLTVYDRNVASTSPIPVIHFVANKDAYFSADVSDRPVGWELSTRQYFSLLNVIDSKDVKKDEDGNLLNGGRTSKNYFVNCTMWYTYIDPQTGDHETLMYPDVDVYLQGTSSLTYPVKNFQIKIYDQLIDPNTKLPVRDANGRLLHGDPMAFNPPGTSIEDGWFQESAANVYTLKCDYMEQSHRNNTPTAKFYEEVIDFVRTNVTNTYSESDRYTPAAAALKTVTTTDVNGVQIEIPNQHVYRDAINGFGCLVYYNDNESISSNITEVIDGSAIKLSNRLIIKDSISAKDINGNDIIVTYKGDVAYVGAVQFDLNTGNIIVAPESEITVTYKYNIDCNDSPVSAYTFNSYKIFTGPYTYDLYDTFAGSYMFNVDKEGTQLGFEVDIEDTSNPVDITYPAVDSTTGAFMRDENGDVIYETLTYNNSALTRNVLPCVSLEGKVNTSGIAAASFYSYKSFKDYAQAAGLSDPYGNEAAYFKETLDPRFAYIDSYKKALGGKDSPTFKAAYDKVVYNRLRGTIYWLETTLSDSTYTIDISDITEDYVKTAGLVKRSDFESDELFNTAVTEYTQQLKQKTYEDRLNNAKKDKFTSEFGDYFSFTYCLAYYLQMLVFTQTDNAGKNAMFDTWGGVLYPRPYDMDTQMGLNNQGQDEVVIGAELSVEQDSTAEIGSYANVAECWSTYNPVTGKYDNVGDLNRFDTLTHSYSTNSSNLWNAFSKYFGDIIAETYGTLRDNLYNVDTICDFVDGLTKDVIGESFYNKDAISKYINTIKIDNYLYSCQGNRSSRYRNFLEQRLIFLDTKFGYTRGDTLNTSITFRSSLPSGSAYMLAPIAIQVYSPQYVTIDMQESNSYKYYIEPNSKYFEGSAWHEGALIHLPVSANNANWIIRGSGNIKEIKHMENLNLTFAQINSAKRLTALSITDSKAFAQLELDDNTYLRSINLSGCNGFGAGYTSLNLNDCVNLKTLDISGTNLTSLSLASGSPISDLNIRNSSLGSLTFINLPHLKSENISICDKETGIGAPPVTAITIDNCPHILDIPYGLPNISSITLRNMPSLTEFVRSGTFTNISIENCDNLTKIDFSVGNTNLSNLAYGSGDTSIPGLLNLSTVPSLVNLNLSGVSSTIPITVQLANPSQGANLKHLNIASSVIADIRSTNVEHSRPYVDLNGFSLNSFTADHNTQLLEVRNLTLEPQIYNTSVTKDKLMIPSSSHSTGFTQNSTQNTELSKHVTSLSSAFNYCHNLVAVSGTIRNCSNLYYAFNYAYALAALCYDVTDDLSSYPTGIIPKAYNNGTYMLKFEFDDDFRRYVEYRDVNNPIYSSKDGDYFSISASALFFSDQKLTTDQVNVLFKQYPYITHATHTLRSCTGVTTAPDISSWTRVKSFDWFMAGSGITSILDTTKPGGTTKTGYFDGSKNSITSMVKTFYNCDKLTSVSSNTFKKLKRLKDLRDCFADSFTKGKSLTIFGSDFDLLPEPDVTTGTNELTDISGMFRDCGELQAPTGSSPSLIKFFKDAKNLQYAEYVFRCYHKLTEIPDNVLQYNTKLISINGLFSYCTGVTAVPRSLFGGTLNSHSQLKRASGLFFGCYSMGTSGRIENNIVRSSLFTGAENLTNIGYDRAHYTISDGSSRAQSLGAFALTAIQGYEIGAFDALKKLTDISYLFSLGKLSALSSSSKCTFTLNTSAADTEVNRGSLPSNLSFNVYVNNGGTYSSIASNLIYCGLFKDQSKLVCADGVFAGRTSIVGFCNSSGSKIITPTNVTDLTQTPTIFSSSTHPDLKYVDALFYGCSNWTDPYYLTLFRLNTKLIRARKTFSSCTSLTGSLSENIFVGSTSLSQIDGLFQGCTNLGSSENINSVSIPNKIFQPIKSTLTTASLVFSSCGFSGTIGVGSKAITTGDNRTDIGLFSGCLSLTSIFGIFANCYRLKGAIPQDMFYEYDTSIVDTKLENISCAFLNCYGLGTNYGSTPTAPSLRGGNPQTVYGVLSPSINTASGRFVDYLIPDNWLGPRAAITNIDGLFSAVHSTTHQYAKYIYPDSDSINSSQYPIIRYKSGSNDYNAGTFNGTTGDNYLTITNNSLAVTNGTLGIAQAERAFSHNCALYGTLNYNFLNSSLNSLWNVKYIFGNCTSLSQVGSATSTIFAPAEGSTRNTALTDLEGAFYNCTSLSGYGPKLINLSTEANTKAMVQKSGISSQSDYTDVQRNGGQANPINLSQFSASTTVSLAPNTEVQA